MISGLLVWVFFSSVNSRCHKLLAILDSVISFTNSCVEMFAAELDQLIFLP